MHPLYTRLATPTLLVRRRELLGERKMPQPPKRRSEAGVVVRRHLVLGVIRARVRVVVVLTRAADERTVEYVRLRAGAAVAVSAVPAGSAAVVGGLFWGLWCVVRFVTSSDHTWRKEENYIFTLSRHTAMGPGCASATYPTQQH